MYKKINHTVNNFKSMCFCVHSFLLILSSFLFPQSVYFGRIRKSMFQVCPCTSNKNVVKATVKSCLMCTVHFPRQSNWIYIYVFGIDKQENKHCGLLQCQNFWLSIEYQNHSMNKILEYFPSFKPFCMNADLKQSILSNKWCFIYFFWKFGVDLCV